MARHILCADDSKTIQRALEMTFAREDVRLSRVGSIREALGVARRDKPDLVLADAALGTESGYDLCRLLKSEPGLRDVPVLLLTSSDRPYDERRGKSAGAFGSIVKPFDTQTMLDQAQQAIGIASWELKPVAPAPPPPVRPAPSAVPAAQKTPAPPSRPIPIAPKPAPLVPLRPVLGRPSMIGGPGAAAATVAPAPLPAPTAATQPVSPRAIAGPLPLSPVPTANAAATIDAAASKVADELAELGLSAAEVAVIVKLSREVIERVAWEVVPELAEAIIRSELDRLAAERSGTS
jgi:CheY-like chemotaxis protein